MDPTKITLVVGLLVLVVGVMHVSAAPDGWIPISDCEELQAVNECLDCNYYLTDDIDCSETEFWDGGAGFEPIGGIEGDDPFTGEFHGNGYCIYDLHISREEEFIGLFGVTAGHIERVCMIDPYIEGVAIGMGALVGFALDEELALTIEDCMVLSMDEGGVFNYLDEPDGIPVLPATGGLVGIAGDEIRNCYSINSVLGLIAGGLVGAHIDELAIGTIRNSFAYSEIEGELTGGLVGINGWGIGDEIPGGLIHNSYWGAVDDSADSCWGDDIDACEDGLECTCTEFTEIPGDLFDINKQPMTAWDFERVWDPSNDDTFVPMLRRGCTDFDDDGYMAGDNCGPEDCDDEDPEVNPGAREKENCKDGIDNDCDGRVDCKDSNCKRKKYCDSSRGAVKTLYWGPSTTIPLPPAPVVEEIINQTPEGAGMQVLTSVSSTRFDGIAFLGFIELFLGDIF